MTGARRDRIELLAGGEEEAGGEPAIAGAVEASIRLSGRTRGGGLVDTTAHVRARSDQVRLDPAILRGATARKVCHVVRIVGGAVIEAAAIRVTQEMDVLARTDGYDVLRRCRRAEALEAFVAGGDDYHHLLVSR